jgi:hypothetical protein
MERMIVASPFGLPSRVPATRWESRTLFRVCSPACGGELARCEAARWPNRTEGAPGSTPALVDPFSANPLRTAAIAAVHLPRCAGEDTLDRRGVDRGRARTPCGGTNVAGAPA